MELNMFIMFMLRLYEIHFENYQRYSYFRGHCHQLKAAFFKKKAAF